MPNFDVVAENFKAGTMDRLGLGYDVVAALHPGVIYVSVSGFGNGESPYARLAAPTRRSSSRCRASTTSCADQSERPRANPVGALGDISSALFAVIGILAALRHRDRTGAGQHVDVAMYDATVAMTDIVTNFASMGIERSSLPCADDPRLVPRVADGWFVMQLVREHQFERLATVVGQPEWVDDPAWPRRAGSGRAPRRRHASRRRGMGGRRWPKSTLHAS